MAYTTFAGNATSFPAAVRAATGSDPRNATTEAATASDLADRTAYLNRRGPASFLASTAELVASTDTSPKYVDQDGWYSHSAATLTPINGVILTAIGVGFGVWVRQDRASLFASSDGGTGATMRIDPRFLQPQYQWTVPLAMTNRLADRVTSTSLTTISGSIIDIPGLLAGDLIVGLIGPITVYNDHASSDATFQLVTQDNATGASPDTPLAEISLTIPGTTMVHGPVGAMTIPFQHTVATEGTTRFYVRLAAAATASIWISTFDLATYALGQITLHRGYVP